MTSCQTLHSWIIGTPRSDDNYCTTCHFILSIIFPCVSEKKWRQEDIGLIDWYIHFIILNQSSLYISILSLKLHSSHEPLHKSRYYWCRCLSPKDAFLFISKRCFLLQSNNLSNTRSLEKEEKTQQPITTTTFFNPKPPCRSVCIPFLFLNNTDQVWKYKLQHFDQSTSYGRKIP